MVNISLVGGWPTPLKNIIVNGKDDIPYIMENKSHVPNHQPDNHSSTTYKQMFETTRSILTMVKQTYEWGDHLAMMNGGFLK